VSRIEFEQDHDDFAIEAIPGLPGDLPAGEKLLWQGKPDWRGIAIDVLHVRKVALYFALVAAWGGVGAVRSGGGLAELGPAVAGPGAAAVCALALLCGLALAMSRSTIYSITTARVVLRIGVALPISVNLPFAQVQSAALRERAGARGELLLELQPGERVGYVVLWPHVRPWRYSRPQPLLRALPDARAAARILSDALRSSADASGVAVVNVDAAADRRPRFVPTTTLGSTVGGTVGDAAGGAVGGIPSAAG
jgi:hypothetical protein